MLRYVILLGLVSAIAVSWAGFFAGDQNQINPAIGSERDQVAAVVQRDDAPARPVPLSGVERLRGDGRGHHIAVFRLNGLRIEGMIDTGATAVAMNAAIARRAGITPSPADFIYTVDTANGRVRAARAVLDDVSLGSIRVRDVEALVLEGEAPNTVLIGMSFLGRLRSFTHENGTLVLRR